MSCWKASATTSLLAGPAYVSSGVAAPTAPPAAATPSGLVALARSGLARVNAPLTSLPVDAVFGSDTLRSASPAVETTVACDVAAYVLATPGVNAPNAAGAPSE